MPDQSQASASWNDDRIRQPFYEAIDYFPADARATAERWLFERGIARIFFNSIARKPHSAATRQPRCINRTPDPKRQ
jgi:hypothetical protein